MYVVAHVDVGLDGGTRIDRRGTPPAFGEDVVLAGSDTIIARQNALWEAPLPGPDPDGPLLAVVDSRDRISMYDALRECGRYRDVIALRGAPRVDLRGALHDLDADVVRVDSGGVLIGALLEDRLVDEISLLVHPVLAPGPRWWGRAEVRRGFEPRTAERRDDGLVRLRYTAT
jgi:2,5-diamino-6-(ribosylamino)-4(3H)-pyrimidinone 5'-phosphate reductase